MLESYENIGLQEVQPDGGASEWYEGNTVRGGVGRIMKAHRSGSIFGCVMVFGCALVVFAGLPARTAWSSQAPAGQTAIPGVVAAGTRLEVVEEGFANLDGVVRGPDGALYFSDTGEGQTYEIRPDGTTEIFSDQNNGATGLGFDSKGRLIVLEGIGGRVVAIDDRKNSTVLTNKPTSSAASEGRDGRSQGGSDQYFLNDLIVDQGGGIYFTDPTPKSQGGDTRLSRVLYVKPGAQPVLVTNAVKRPTGITLSLDERTLFIADSDENAIMAMDVRQDGTAANLHRWTQLENIGPGRTATPEGMAIDADGRVYVATVLGVQVYGPTGGYLGTIAIPRTPSNVAFGGPDRKTLYITARSTLYGIRMLSVGPASRAK